jgi:hypothetical protein
VELYPCCTSCFFDSAPNNMETERPLCPDEYRNSSSRHAISGVPSHASAGLRHSQQRQMASSPLAFVPRFEINIMLGKLESWRVHEDAGVSTGQPGLLGSLAGQELGTRAGGTAKSPVWSTPLSLALGSPPLWAPPLGPRPITILSPEGLLDRRGEPLPTANLHSAVSSAVDQKTSSLSQPSSHQAQPLSSWNRPLAAEVHPRHAGYAGSGCLCWPGPSGLSFSL